MILLIFFLFLLFLIPLVFLVVLQARKKKVFLARGMNLVLLQNGYPIAIIPPVVRADYITALVKTNHGNSVPFFNFILSTGSSN